MDYLAVIEQGTQDFAGLLERGDLQTPVPSCPGWALLDLAGHLGEVHQWAVHAIVHGNPDARTTDAPAAALAEWYRESAGLLLRTLRETPEDAPAWHFGAKPRLAGWWRRRQAHEVTIHLHDARSALGQVEPIDAALAVDGLDEVRNVFFPRQVRLGRRPALESPLSFVVSETGERFVFDGDGTVLEDEAQADATVSGPAEALYLAVWGRLPLEDPRLRVSGNAAAVQAALGVGLVP
ncbi:maleylpyruvate isomerase family mycothiol-dependent enzyme [Kineosporia babensis]|uniref:Maleylpyruvate isomerase family mycothiol-dependent enzyme n=1 Tax=Kineosporia babensis TaxID=499548 RepID=A0A9X1NB53_9ACTN|nr:maleylpyruvate isomerase family mycothiol-dependent enzyme [Kineosporia babensis]